MVCTWSSSMSPGNVSDPLTLSEVKFSSEDTKKLSNINGLFAASSNTPRVSRPFLSWSRSTFRLLRIVCSIRLSTKSCRFNTWKANDMTKSNCNWIIFGSVHYLFCLPIPETLEWSINTFLWCTLHTPKTNFLWKWWYSII